MVPRGGEDLYRVAWCSVSDVAEAYNHFFFFFLWLLNGYNFERLPV